MSEKWSIRAEVARKIREMGPQNTAVYFFTFLLFFVMPTLAGAGYLLAYLADLYSGCGA